MKTEQEQTILIRTEATPSIGTGHLMRCLTLAQSLSDRAHSVRFVVCEGNHFSKDLIEDAGFIYVSVNAPSGSVQDADSVVALCEEHRAKWVILDGYQFDDEYQRSVKASDRKLLVIDDFAHLTFYDADVVLNQNIWASASLYADKTHAALLLGSDFILLRSEFLQFQQSERTIKESARRIVVTLGGSDPHNVTLKILESLELCSENALEVFVVAGACNQHERVLEEFAKKSKHRMILLRNVRNMPELFQKCDLAIASGGTTCWEMTFMSLPMLLIQIADNQAENCRNLQRLGAALALGDWKKFDIHHASTVVKSVIQNKFKRQEMSRSCHSLVDGFGARRVAEFMESLLASQIKRDR